MRMPGQQHFIMFNNIISIQSGMYAKLISYILQKAVFADSELSYATLL